MPNPAFQPCRTTILAWIVGVSMFMAQLDSTVIATALPQMATSFRTSATNLSLGLSIYLLVQAVLLPASNWLSDRYGARRIFGGAVLLFIVSSALCGLSTVFWQFIAARVLQGGAAALMTPVGRVVLIRATPRDQLVHILSMTAMPMLLAPMLGPPLGGFIVSYLSWPWVFYINIPFGLICFGFILAFVPDVRTDASPPFDVTGFVLLALALSGLIYGLDRITAAHNSHGFAALYVVGGGVFTWASLHHLRRTPHPILPLRAWSSPIFRTIAGEAGFFARLPMRAVPFVMPLALQIGLHMNAFAAGIIIMASAAGDLGIKPLVRSLLRRVGFRSALVGSQLLSCLMIALLAAELAGAPAALLFLVLGVLGIARSVLFSAMSSLLYADIEDRDAGAATVLWNVVQQLTNAFAVSFSVIIINLSARARGEAPGQEILADFQVALLALAVIGIPALVALWRLPRNAGIALSRHSSGDEPIVDEA